MLTEKQSRVLDCIKSFINEHKYPPTVRELCKMVGLKSSSTVEDYLNKLEEKGYISRTDKIARSIRVI